MTFAHDPADLGDDELAALDGMTDDELAKLFDRDHTDVEVLLLAGYGRPATRTPQPLDLYRGLDTLPALDDYRPTPSEDR